MRLCAYVCAYFALACILTYAFAYSDLFVSSHSFACIWPRFSMFPFVMCLCLRWILHLLFVLVHFGATSMLVCAFVLTFMLTSVLTFMLACLHLCLHLCLRLCLRLRLPYAHVHFDIRFCLLRLVRELSLFCLSLAPF